MEIKCYSNELKEKWNNFVLACNEAWFWHTIEWSEYCVSYGSINFETKNISFLVEDTSGIIAICPLFLEKKEVKNGQRVNLFSASGGGGFIPTPALRNDLSDGRKEKVLKFIFEAIDVLARENNVACVLFRMVPIAYPGPAYNHLLRYGFLEATLSSQIIDLSLPIEKLWSDVRKGHKCDINRGMKYYTVDIFDKDNIKKEIFDKYRLLHHKAAGRVTRPIETFEMMYNWILQGYGMLCGASKNDEYAGFAYINLYKDGAYYSSASDDPDFKTAIPLSHVIQWSTIKWLKEHGYRNYDIGIQQFSCQLYDSPSKKDIDISFFKRGFGGKTVALFKGEKYYSREYLVLRYEDRFRMMIDTMMTSPVRK